MVSVVCRAHPPMRRCTHQRNEQSPVGRKVAMFPAFFPGIVLDKARRAPHTGADTSPHEKQHKRADAAHGRASFSTKLNTAQMTVVGVAGV